MIDTKTTPFGLPQAIISGFATAHDHVEHITHGRRTVAIRYMTGKQGSHWVLSSGAKRPDRWFSEQQPAIKYAERYLTTGEWRGR